MSDENDDLSGEDADQGAEELHRLSGILYERVVEFAEDEDVSDEALPFLLLQLSLSLRMMTYIGSVAKPSAAGLKLDLDRYQREASDLIREMKKDADQFIAKAREEIAAAELEEDDET
jgi:hypothetical protein